MQDIHTSLLLNCSIIAPIYQNNKAYFVLFDLGFDQESHI
jgi:hypothetical protein